MSTRPRTILVTGVTRGLGLALVHRFAALGHEVLGCGRDAARIAALTAELPPPHDFQTVDVADRRQVEGWAAGLLGRGRTPDLIINNAGLINRSVPLWEVPPDEIEAIIDVNIKGTIWVIQAFVQAMAAAGGGVIPYVATKWAIEGLTQALAAELPSSVAVVSVNPGIIHTAMLETCFGAVASSFPPPAEWATQAAPFLLELSSEDNGEALTAPGG